MIVRAYLDNPEMLFDYFNDYDNTRDYLLSIMNRVDNVEASRAAVAVMKLDAGYREWSENRMAEIRERLKQ